MWEGSFSKGQELMSIPRPDPQPTAWSLFVTLLPRAVFICSGGPFQGQTSVCRLKTWDPLRSASSML